MELYSENKHSGPVTPVFNKRKAINYVTGAKYHLYVVVYLPSERRAQEKDEHKRERVYFVLPKPRAVLSVFLPSLYRLQNERNGI